MDHKKNKENKVVPKLGHWYSAAISRSWKRNPKITATKTNLMKFVLKALDIVVLVFERERESEIFLIMKSLCISHVSVF